MSKGPLFSHEPTAFPKGQIAELGRTMEVCTVWVEEVRAEVSLEMVVTEMFRREAMCEAGRPMAPLEPIIVSRVLGFGIVGFVSWFRGRAPAEVG
jgi:hypothetical protein